MDRRKFLKSTSSMALALALPAPFYAFGEGGRSGKRSVDAMTFNGRETVLGAAELDELNASLRGPLLLPEDSAYEQARHVLNGAIDKHPALIVQPTGNADIANIVQFASDHKLLTAVKCGGHSSSGMSTCDGGLVIDLSAFRHVQVLPEKRIARVSGGSLLGALDHESMAHGLVTTSGTVSHTGVGGLTTGGGFGRLARRFGLALDNVVALDIVGADGVLRRASADENADLFWAVRGGGGNFGVVSNFEFQLHPMSRTVMAGALVYPIERIRDVLDFYAQFSLAAPPELAADLILVQPPAGKPGVAVLALCYCGDPAQAEKATEAVASLGKPLAGKLQPTDYVALQRSNDSDAPRALASYLKGGFISEFSPSLFDTISEGLQPHAKRSTRMIFQQAGGAIKEVPASATAFAHRYAENNMMLTLDWDPTQSDQEHVRDIKAFWSKLAPYTHGFYANEADDENAPLVNSNYQGNYSRLLEIKKRYDPQNLFRLNANISSVA